jgi:endoglucanase
MRIRFAAVLVFVYAGFVYTLLAGPVENFQNLPDNRVAVRTSLGVRSAKALSGMQIQLVIGLSSTPAAAEPLAYRIISLKDPNYAYEKFVTPLKAEMKSELEAEAPSGCQFNKFEKKIVTLDLPFPMLNGIEYHVVGQGAKGQLVTGAHTAANFIYDPSKTANGTDNSVDMAVLGVRQLESVGNGVIKLEFGPDFSAAACGNLDNYTVKINGTAVKPVNFGRHTKVDTYLPEGWPFQAIPMHYIFLQLPQPLKEGDKIEVEVSKNITTAGNKAAISFSEKSAISNSIKVNQIGYLTDSPVKIAYLGRWMGSFPEMKNGAAGQGPALSFPQEPEFKVCNLKDGTAVFTGKSKFVHKSGDVNEGVYKVDHSGENVYQLDFTDVKTPGSYYISVDGVGRSLPFQIGDDVYKKAFDVQSYGVFAQRCGIELKPPYSEWRRIACHNKGLNLTKKSRFDGEFADGKNIVMKPDNPNEPVVIKVSGGHHDAGDYNPRAHLDVAQKLMDVYEIAPQKFYDGQLNIPEKGNGIPDILDEAYWALKIWIDLQDKDGGVYDGTESAKDPNFMETVELDPCGDYAYPKDAAGSYHFAGAFAKASRLWKSVGKSKEAEDFLSRAKKAYEWAEKNPDKFKDEDQKGMLYLSPKAYAAAELLCTTGDAKYNKDFMGVCAIVKKPDAAPDEYKKYDQKLAFWAYAQCKPEYVDPVVQENVKKSIIRMADLFIELSSKMAYGFIRHPWSPINWGTGAYENHLPVILWSYKLTGDKKYLYWIVRTCDNTLGANPMNLSYIVGAGAKTVRAPLHNSRYGHMGEVVNGQQVEGPVQKGDGYRVVETTYPKIQDNFASLYTFVDNHFAIGMDEGVVPNQAQSMAIFGFLLPDKKENGK